jgi:hypothetical protein
VILRHRQSRVALRARRIVSAAIEPLEDRRLLSVPNGPYGLSVSSPTASSLALRWYDNANDETGFAVERRLATDSNWQNVATLPANTIAWQDGGLAAGTTYVYRVHAFSAGGNSAYTLETSGTTIGTQSSPPPVTPPVNATTVPNGPYGLSAAVSGSQVSLHWYDPANNEDGFVVERKTTGGWSTVATVGANVVNYGDTSVSPATTYTYRVHAYNSLGISGYTQEVSIMSGGTVAQPPPVTPPPTVITVPNGPYAMSAAASSPTQVVLNWYDNHSNEAGYVVERQTGSSGWMVAGTLGPTAVTFNDTTAAATTYSYRVHAYNSLGDSGYASTNVTTPGNGTPPPVTPPPVTPPPTTGTGSPVDLSTFFPIGVFYQPTWSFDTWKARGVNTLLGYEDPSGIGMAAWSQAARDRGLHYFREASADPKQDIGDNSLIAWLNPIDEPDIHDPTGAASAATYGKLHAADPNIPALTTYAGGYFLGLQQGKDKNFYENLFQYTDWLAPCVYPITGWGMPDGLSNVGKLVDITKSWAPGKRQMAYIECANQNLPWVGPLKRGPTPDEYRGEVWDALIHGATGIIYFPDSLVPFAYDNTEASVSAEMTTQDARVSRLGGMLLSAENPAGISVAGEIVPAQPNGYTGSIETAWRVYNGHTYLIVENYSAYNLTNVSLATSGLTPGKTFTVDGENRSVGLQGTNLVDNFKPYEVHVYVS